MKKVFLSLALVAAAATAWAVPNPRQIEQALEHGNCAQARNLVNEVLAAKPDSARAHLLNSATIMCLERDAALAQRELNAVRELDRKGDVVSSNLFAKMESDIAAAQRPVYTPPVQTYTPPVVAQQAPAVVAQPAVVKPADEGSSFLSKFFVLLLLAAGAGGIYWLWKRNSTSDNSPVGGSFIGPDETPASTRSATSTSSTPSSSYPARRYDVPVPARRYTPPPAPTYTAPAPVVVNNGPSALETGVAVAGGVVVGNAISDALRKPAHDDSYSRRRREEDTSSVYSSSAPAPAPYVPAPTPAPAPSVFSSSSDDGWGSAPAPAPSYSSSRSSSYSSSSDDDSSSRSSWSSSSSSDYSSSSSSDYSSSSSSDSSSSSSSSDW